MDLHNKQIERLNEAAIEKSADLFDELIGAQRSDEAREKWTASNGDRDLKAATLDRLRERRTDLVEEFADPSRMVP